MAFQTSVATNPSPGIEGGFAGANPYFSLITPDEGMFVADSTNPPIVGKMGWVNTANGKVSSQHPGVTTTRIGFVPRSQAVLANTTMLSGSSMTVIAGSPVGVAEDGVFWGRFAAGATIGQKVYASYQDGSLSAAATGSASTVTRSVTTTNTSTAISYTGGAIYPGQPVSGTGIPAGAYIVSVNATAGTAVLSAAATASGTVTGTFTTNFETAFTVRSTAGNGELAKISVRG
jgi:hypothetical protein